MKKVILYIAESLDGYVATKDGSVAWLDEFNDVPNVDYGYAKFIDDTDTVVQGNTTFQQFKHAYEGKSNFVFTEDTDTRLKEGITSVKGGIKGFIDGLDETVHKNIWLVGGPNLLTQFINEEQLDEMIIFVMPVLLGNGIPLFSNLKTTPDIILQNTKTYENGVIEIHYIIKK
jgi:dihydrofolate reductase